MTQDETTAHELLNSLDAEDLTSGRAAREVARALVIARTDERSKVIQMLMEMRTFAGSRYEREQDDQRRAVVGAEMEAYFAVIEALSRCLHHAARPLDTLRPLPAAEAVMAEENSADEG